MLLNRPAFALIAVLALSLGVGAIGLKPDLVGVAQGQAEISLEGDWIGGWQDKGAWVSVKAQFMTEQGTLKATFDLLQALEGPKSFAVGKVSLTGAAFRLEATKDAVILVLEGRLDGATIKGEWRRADERGAFTLLRVAKVEPKLFDQYVGSYQLDPDNFISIGRQTRTGQNPRLCYVERKSGRRGNLTSLSDMTFIGGPALGLDYPADVQITFVKNSRGEIEGLQWRRGQAKEMFAKTLWLKEEEVKFPSGAHVLAGTLAPPPTPGPPPVCRDRKTSSTIIGRAVSAGPLTLSAGRSVSTANHIRSSAWRRLNFNIPAVSSKYGTHLARRWPKRRRRWRTASSASFAPWLI